MGIDEEGKQKPMEYISVLDVLKLVLVKEDVIAHITRPKGKSGGGILDDYDDGKFFKQHELFFEDDLPLRLHFYTDEFEVAKPLGSKKSIHKMRAYYFRIGNTISRYRSKFEKIFLAMLFPYKLLSKDSHAEHCWMS